MQANMQSPLQEYMISRSIPRSSKWISQLATVLGLSPVGLTEPPIRFIFKTNMGLAAPYIRLRTQECAY